MPPKYGDHESFKQQADELKKFDKIREEQQLKLAGYQQDLEKTLGLESESQRAAHTTRKARREAVAAQEAEARITGSGVRAKELDAEAIERSIAARRRLTTAQLNLNRVFAGAQDPLLGRAAALAPGDVPSQYQIRKQFKEQGYGVGSQRARNLQEALQGGIRPQGPLATPAGPLTRVQQAEVDQTRAAQELTNATKARSALLKGSATDAQIALANANVTAAKDTRTAANLELKSAQEEAVARGEDAAAAKREAAMRTRSSEAQAVAPINRQIPQRTGYAPPGSLALQTGQLVPRTPVKEMPVQFGGGNAYYDSKVSPAFSDKEIERKAESTRRSAAADTNAAAAERDFGRATRAANIELATLGNDLQRHGALTQEFILAAGRGQTTFRELGAQVGVTIGKFAGWTAAAGAVFGVLRAVQEFGAGARESASGVQQLTRFIPELNKTKVRIGFEDIARDVNVPMAEVSQAATVFGRVFHNANDVLTATRVSLVATKLDQVSLADSTRFLVGIQQEWGLTASQLPGVFDQVSNAQRRMGARVQETLPALARSGAAVKAQGGDLSQLVALLATAQVATGQTGNVVGTAFYRGASQFFRRPSNIPIEKKYGLDPEGQGFTEFLISAVRRAQTLKGPQRAELAKAIFGPQYGGRIGTGLLGQEKRLDKALGVTSPAQAKGSAAEELHHQLATVDEQIKKIGVSLQVLGSELARGGFFIGLGLGLKTLNSILTVTQGIIKEFDKLPAPIRHGVALLGEAALVMKGLRHFGGEALLAVPGFGSQGAKDQALKKAASKAARDYEVGARSSLAASFGQFTRAQTQLEATTKARNVAVGQFQQGIAAGTLVTGTKEYNAALAQNQRLTDRAVQLQNAVNDAELTLNEEKALANAALAERTTIAGLQGKQLREYLAAQNYPIPRTMQTPTLRGVETAPGRFGPTVPPEVTTPTGVVLPTGGAAAKAAATTAKEAELAAANVGVLASRGAQLQRSFTEMTDKLNKGGYIARGVGTAALAGAGATAGAAKAAGGMVAGLRSFVAGLSFLDVALIGVVAYLAVLKPALDAAQKKDKDLNKRLSTYKVGRQPSGIADLRQRHNDIRDAQDAHAGFLASFTSDITHPLDFLNPLPHKTVLEKQLDRTRGRGRDQAAQQKALEDAYYKNQRELEDQLGSRDTSKPLKGLYANQISGEIQSISNNTLIDTKTWVAFVTKIRTEISKGNLTADEVQKLLDDLQHARRIGARKRHPTLLQQTVAADPKDLQKYIDYEASRLKEPGYHAKRTDFKVLNEAYRRLSRNNLRLGDIDSLTALQKGADDFIQARVEYAQRLADEAKKRGAGPAAIKAIFDKALNAVGGALGVARGDLAKLRAALRAVEEKIRELEAAAGATPTPQHGGRRLVPDTGTAVQDQRNLNSLRNQKKDLTGKIRSRSDILHTIAGAIKQSEEQSGQAMEQSVLDKIRADNELAQALVSADPSRVAAVALSGERQVLAYMRSHKQALGLNAADIVRQQAAVVQAEQNAANEARQNAIDVAKLQGDLRSARSGGDPLATARAGRQAAQIELRYARTRKERLQALVDLARADNEIDDALRQGIEADYGLKESRTGDPLKKARLEVGKDKALLRHARGLERKQLRAQLNNDRRAQKQQRVDSGEEDIEFALSMERITSDVAIQQYRHLLRTKGLVKATRRQILQRIHELQKDEDQNSLDINIGSLRLPTIYDVRRLAKQGTNTAPVVQNSNSYTFHVRDGSDIEAIGGHLDRIHGGHVRSSQRSAGLR